MLALRRNNVVDKILKIRKYLGVSYFANFSFLKYLRVLEFVSKCLIYKRCYLNIVVFKIGENFEFTRQQIYEY